MVLNKNKRTEEKQLHRRELRFRENRASENEKEREREGERERECISRMVGKLDEETINGWGGKCKYCRLRQRKLLRET